MNLPPPQNNYGLAFRIATDVLRKADLDEVCRRSGAAYRPEDSVIEVPFLKYICRILLPQWTFLEPDLSLPEQVLVLHYLLHASGTPLKGRWISFSEVPGGATYFPAFRSRSIEPFLRHFSGAGRRLIEAARALGGEEFGYGDVGVVFRAFPRVKVAFVLWEGDEEVPPNANVLFDETVSDYLSTEDISELSWRLVHRMIRTSRNGGKL